MPGRLPTFIIAGAMRSGTTALNSYLRSHPQIAVSGNKELDFFDHRFDLGTDWYAAQFRDADGADAVGEATPSYMYSQQAVDRIADVLPDVSLIIMLRNPMDRAYSHYWHDRARDKVEGEFADVVNRELTDSQPETAYVDRGRYRWQLERVLARFPRDAVHVIMFDDFVAEPHETYEGVCRFLGVSENHKPPTLGESVNAYVEFRSVALRRVGKRLPTQGRRILGRLNRKQHGATYPPMDPGTRLRLQVEYAEANKGLSDLLSVPIPDWE